MCTPDSGTLHTLLSGMRIERCIVGKIKSVIRLYVLLPVVSFAAVVQAQDLGRVLSNEELELLPQHVFADGQGLPQGQGAAEHGFELYVQHCAACHGGRGEGGRALELVGDRSLLATEYPDRGIAVYWPYAPTLFEYIKRSMPPANPYSLTDDQVYAIIAALLVLNELIEPDQVVDAAFLSALDMPNRNGFRSRYKH